MAPDDPRRKNLRPPIKKGEVRNPTGKNGADWLGAFKEYFADKDVDFTVPKGKDAPKVPRIRNVWAAMYRRALLGDGRAQELIAHYMQGPPRQSVELTGPDGTPIGGGPQVVLYLPDNGDTEPDDDEQTAPAAIVPDVGTSD